MLFLLAMTHNFKCSNLLEEKNFDYLKMAKIFYDSTDYLNLYNPFKSNKLKNYNFLYKNLFQMQYNHILFLQ